MLPAPILIATPSDRRLARHYTKALSAKQDYFLKKIAIISDDNEDFKIYSPAASKKEIGL